MGYTNVLQWVGDNLKAREADSDSQGFMNLEEFRINISIQQRVGQHLTSKEITEENYTPQTVIVGSKTFVIETYRGYACLIGALSSETEEEYEKYMQAAIKYEVNS